jgi:hypothetical protein
LEFTATDDYDATPIPVFDSSRTAPRLAHDSFSALDTPFAITADDGFYETAI